MTLVIILGILVLIAVITIYSFREELFQSDWEVGQSLSISVPSEAEELHDYLSDCVEETVEEPVLILGQQGGYVYMPEDPIGEGEHNTFSNALEIFEDTDFVTAYWYYMAANGVAQDQVPTLETMEEQLEQYVDENLAGCATDFEIFEEYNATVGDIATEVEIESEEVFFTVYYPVKIVLDDFEYEFEAFYESVDVPLGTMYEQAVEIMETENEELVLEELTYDMFVLYEDIPLSWSDFECEEETWDFEEVEDDLKEILMQNFFAVKIVGTDYSILEENDEGYFELNLMDSSSEFSANVWYLE